MIGASKHAGNALKMLKTLPPLPPLLLQLGIETPTLLDFFHTTTTKIDYTVNNNATSKMFPLFKNF